MNYFFLISEGKRDLYEMTKKETEKKKFLVLLFTKIRKKNETLDSWIRRNDRKSEILLHIDRKNRENSLNKRICFIE